MEGTPRDPDYGDDTDIALDHETIGMPRWVKVFGIIGLVVVLLFVIALVAGGGSHGPGRHTPGGQAQSSGVAEPGGHTAPAGARTQP
jgi:hypothetical protein